MHLKSTRNKEKNIFKKIINKAIGVFGYKIVRNNTEERIQNYSSDFLNIISKRDYSEFTMLSLANQYALFNAVKHVVLNNIPGDIVECGVWRGGAMMLVADTLTYFNDNKRTLWLYDTYGGMTNPTEKDVDSNGISAASEFQKKNRTETYIDWCYADITDVTTNLFSTDYPKEHIKFIKGDVLKTIPANAPDSISILRLDTDWYESTAHEMKYLYPKLSDKGLLIVDDYGTWSGSKEAIDEFYAGETPFMHRVDHTAVLIVK